MENVPHMAGSFIVKELGRGRYPEVVGVAGSGPASQGTRSVGDVIRASGVISCGPDEEGRPSAGLRCTAQPRAGRSSYWRGAGRTDTGNTRTMKEAHSG